LCDREAALSTHLSIENELHAEADRLLSGGLQDMLDTFGDVHIVGSYALGLMTWRDLDIHVVREPLERGAFFDLGRRIADHLQPHRMHFRDETIEATPGLPRGLYWGVYLGNEREGAWKIDIWATSSANFEPTRRFCDAIAKRLTPETRESILQIKAACWQHPEYRRGFSSADIYEAVFEHGVRTVDQFWSLRRRDSH
jgi:hypothetical protein